MSSRKLNAVMDKENESEEDNVNNNQPEPISGFVAAISDNPEETLETTSEEPLIRRGPTSSTRRTERTTCSCSDITFEARSPLDRSGQVQCQSCGKLVVENSADQPTVLDQGYMYAVGLPASPQSLQGDSLTSTQESRSPSVSERSRLPVTGRQRLGIKSPVEDTMNLDTHSIQWPSPGTNSTLFLLGKDHPARNEKWFWLFVVPSKDWPEIKHRIWRTAPKGSKLCSFGDERANLAAIKYFEEIFVEDQIRIKYELTTGTQIEGKFRITWPYAYQPKTVIKLYDVLSKSHNRIAPGACAALLLECLGAPDEICQGHVRIKIEKYVRGKVSDVFTKLFPICRPDLDQLP